MFPILAAVELNRLEQLDPFTVVFMSVDFLLLLSNPSGFSGSSVAVFMLNDK